MEEEPKFEFIDTPYREQPPGPHIAALSGVILLICDGIIIPSSGALYVSRESGAKGALTCMKEHRSVDIRNVLGDERMYRAYGETWGYHMYEQSFTT